MVKVLAVLYKRPTERVDEFARAWRDDHRRLSRAIPGAVSCVHRDADTSARPAYGVVELVFRDERTMRTALASPEAEAALGELARAASAARAGMVVVDGVGIVEVVGD